jgi:ACS family hexuronate transporter-like MFS transporter
VRLRVPLQWVAIAVFVLSSSLNYLDRQLLAAVAPTLKTEFSLTDRDYGYLLFAFSVIYAIAAPLAGLFIDRVGLNLGMCVAVAAWSVAGVWTGLVEGFRGLVMARAALGAAEAAGIPGSGKANATYLRPHELALGGAVNQVGLSIGGVAAPLLVAWLGGPAGWRRVFIIAALLGFVWIPLWLFTARRIPRLPEAPSRDLAETGAKELLRDRRFWGLVIANILYMTMYTLWTNWTTLYFVEARGMTEKQANQQFAWIPPIFATLGGFAGAALAFRWIRSGVQVFEARIRVCMLSALLLLATAAIPLMPTAGWAAVAISFSYFWVTAMSTNVYVMPIDFFGADRAAFGVAALTMAYGFMQAFVSPLIGGMIHQFGYAGVFAAFAALPLVAVGVLRVSVPRSQA